MSLTKIYIACNIFAWLLLCYHKKNLLNWLTGYSQFANVHCIVLHYIALYCIALHCIALHWWPSNTVARLLLCYQKNSAQLVRELFQKIKVPNLRLCLKFSYPLPLLSTSDLFVVIIFSCFQNSEIGFRPEMEKHTDSTDISVLLHMHMYMQTS